MNFKQYYVQTVDVFYIYFINLYLFYNKTKKMLMFSQTLKK